MNQCDTICINMIQYLKLISSTCVRMNPNALLQNALKIQMLSIQAHRGCAAACHAAPRVYASSPACNPAVMKTRTILQNRGAGQNIYKMHAPKAGKELAPWTPHMAPSCTPRLNALHKIIRTHEQSLHLVRHRAFSGNCRRRHA